MFTYENLKLFNNLNKDIEWIKRKTVFLTVHGSIAYGLNTPESDIDVRGVCCTPKEYLLGFNKNFDQYITSDPIDCTIFNIQKFFNLTSQGNPNTLELLFVDPEHHIYVDDLGKSLIENKDLFLSKQLKERYIGYAKAQAHRIKNHKRWIDSNIKPPPTREEFGIKPELSISKEQLLTFNSAISKQLDKWNCDFEPFSESQKVYLKNKVSSILSEMNILSDDIWQLAARQLGASENFILILQKEKAYQNLVDDYANYQSWKKNRNSKRAALEAKHGYDLKHATALIRLLKLGKEILETGKVQIKRIHDREELMSIKNGAWKYEDIINYADKIEDEVKEAYKNSKLPNQPNIKKLDQLLINIVEASMSNYSLYNIKKSIKELLNG